MAHFSRLSVVVIDVPAEQHDAAVRFWQAALGIQLDQIQRHQEFHGSPLPYDRYGLLVQRLGDGPPRTHLDIHASDRAAEVARLVGLGATVVEDGADWCVLRDPAGITFCVVPDKRLDATNANQWD